MSDKCQNNCSGSNDSFIYQKALKNSFWYTVQWASAILFYKVPMLFV